MFKNLAAIIALMKLFGPKLQLAWPHILAIISILADVPEAELAVAPAGGFRASREVSGEVDEFVTLAVGAGVDEKKARNAVSHLVAKQAA